jgi:hypothetical protein
MKTNVLLTLAALVAASASAAGPVELYSTGWEAAPASPAWVPGIVGGQNGWVWFNNSNAHQVVVNGSAEAIIGGQAVATPYGSQFHKFTANPSTTATSVRYAWPDITAGLAGLPSTHKIFKASMDVFVPSSQMGVAALYGIAATHDDGSMPWGVLIDPGDLSVNLLWDDGITADSFVPDALEADTWCNVSVTADYTSGQISVAVNGVTLDGITQTGTEILTGTLTDIDLISMNYDLTASTLRSIASDNFRITAEAPAIVRPNMSIAAGPSGSVVLQWSDQHLNWILKTASDVARGPWTTLTFTPNVANGKVTATVTPAPGQPAGYYRLYAP